MALTSGNYADLITFTRASSATYLDSDGILKTASTNEPRIEYDADGNRLGLLVEESRTNLESYSLVIDANWGKSDTTITNNAITAPDGTTTASLVKETTVTSSHRVQGNGIISSGTTYTFSVYAKKKERSVFSIGGAGLFGASEMPEFDVDNGVAYNGGTGNALVSIQDVGNGWYRCSVTYTATGTSGYILQLHDSLKNAPPASASGFIYTGDGSSGMYFWGAQLEAASFPTSYIPTSGSTATRSADVASIGVSEFGYNQSEGTLFVQCQHFTTESGATSASAVALDDGSSSNRMWYYQNKGQWIGSSGGVTQFSIHGSDLAENTEVKASMVYSADDFALYIDGSSVGTDTAGSVAVGVTTLHIGKAGVSGFTLNGHIKSIRYYPRRLTNAQLQELTS